MLISSQLEVSITSSSFVSLHLQVFEKVYCLLLFYKNYIVYYNAYHGYFV